MAQLRNIVLKGLMLCLFTSLPTLLLTAQTQGADSVCISLEKAGKLKKELQKTDLQKVAKLKVIGKVSAKDLRFISELPNLTALYLEEAVYSIGANETITTLAGHMVSKVSIANSNLSTFYGCPYAEDPSAGQRYMIDWEITAHINTLGLNYNSGYYTENVQQLIIYPENEKNKVDGEMLIKVYAQTIHISDTKRLQYTSTTGGSKRDGFYKSTIAVLKDNYHHTLTGDVIVLHENGQEYYYINTFNGDTRYLSNVAFLSLNAFSSSTERYDITLCDKFVTIPSKYFIQTPKIRSIRGNKVKEIENGAFKGCSNLETVVFPTLKTIHDYAFEDCVSLDSLYFPSLQSIGKGFLSGTNLTTFTATPSLKSIHHMAFDKSKLETIEFQSTNRPKVEGLTSDHVMKYPATFIVPVDRRSAYKVGDMKQLFFVEKGDKMHNHFTISVEQPGNILSFINEEQLAVADSLTLTGTLYETDLSVIQQIAERLRYLNMTEAAVTRSPKLQEQADAEAAISSLFIDFSLEAAEELHEKGKTSTLEYELLKKDLTMAKEIDKQAVAANTKHFIPKEFMKGHKRIETVIFPKTTSSIEDYVMQDCPRLRTVILPPGLVWLGQCFDNCTQLENIDIPNTLTRIESSFNLTGIKQLDFSGCNLSNETWRWDYTSNHLTELKLPHGAEEITLILRNNTDKTLQNIYVPASVKVFYCNTANSNIYFEGCEPPTGMKLNNCILHVPQTSKTVYYSAYGSDNTIVGK